MFQIKIPITLVEDWLVGDSIEVQMYSKNVLQRKKFLLSPWILNLKIVLDYKIISDLTCRMWWWAKILTWEKKIFNSDEKWWVKKMYKRQHKVLNVISDRNLTWEKKIFNSDEKWWVKKIGKRQKVVGEFNHQWQKVKIGITQRKLSVSKSTSDQYQNRLTHVPFLLMTCCFLA